MIKRAAKIIGIIPARYGSVRFPGKMLTEILGKSLIQRTYENTQRCPLIDELIVATDDPRIYDHVSKFGNVIMTPVECPTGTDRLAYVVKKNQAYQQADIILNVQGDEPCLDPLATTSIIKALQGDEEAVMSTAVTRIESEDEALNPNEVKCVIDLKGNALYFSRSLIPGGNPVIYRKNVVYYKHIGVYAYRPDFLLEYAKLPSTPLQIAEELEQLKVLENGYKIKAAVVQCRNAGVNTPEDIKKVEQEICKQNSFS